MKAPTSAYAEEAAAQTTDFRVEGGLQLVTLKASSNCGLSGSLHKF